ncbi:MAG: hypothetical protein ACLR17_23200 [Enterobacteriaceae bacterium]
MSITRGALSLNLGGQADVASGGDSHGYSGSLSVGYAFKHPQQAAAAGGLLLATKMQSG